MKRVKKQTHVTACCMQPLIPVSIHMERALFELITGTTRHQEKVSPVHRLALTYKTSRATQQSEMDERKTASRDRFQADLDFRRYSSGYQAATLDSARSSNRQTSAALVVIVLMMAGPSSALGNSGSRQFEKDKRNFFKMLTAAQERHHLQIAGGH